MKDKEWIVKDTLNNKYVQELVRCKDCKQGEQSVLPNRHLWCRIHEFYREPDWFCADGVKKESEING